MSMAEKANEWQDPSVADLAAIEGEWEGIAAALAVVDAEIAMLLVGRPQVDEVAVRRARRRARQVLVSGSHRAAGGEAA